MGIFDFKISKLGRVLKKSLGNTVLDCIETVASSVYKSLTINACLRSPLPEMVILMEHVMSILLLSEIVSFASCFYDDDDSYLSHSAVREQVLEENTLDEENFVIKLDMLNLDLMGDKEFKNVCMPKIDFKGIKKACIMLKTRAMLF
jgi:hypothetical protein